MFHRHSGFFRDLVVDLQLRLQRHNAWQPGGFLSQKKEKTWRIKPIFKNSEVCSRLLPATCFGSVQRPWRSSWCPSAGSLGCPAPPGERWRSALHPPSRPRTHTQAWTRHPGTSLGTASPEQKQARGTFLVRADIHNSPEGCRQPSGPHATSRTTAWIPSCPPGRWLCNSPDRCPPVDLQRKQVAANRSRPLQGQTQPTHPLGVLQAVDGALPAADLVLVFLQRHDSHHQLLLHLLHLLFLGLLGLHLVHDFWPSLFYLVGWKVMALNEVQRWPLTLDPQVNNHWMLNANSAVLHLCWESGSVYVNNAVFMGVAWT